MAKDTREFKNGLYSRHGELQGIVYYHGNLNEIIFFFCEDHNPIISLETMEKWVKQGKALAKTEQVKAKRSTKNVDSTSNKRNKQDGNPSRSNSKKVGKAEKGKKK